jgi:hypothetical protein
MHSTHLAPATQAATASHHPFTCVQHLQWCCTSTTSSRAHDPACTCSTFITPHPTPVRLSFEVFVTSLHIFTTPCHSNTSLRGCTTTSWPTQTFKRRRSGDHARAQASSSLQAPTTAASARTAWVAVLVLVLVAVVESSLRTWPTWIKRQRQFATSRCGCTSCVDLSRWPRAQTGTGSPRGSLGWCVAVLLLCRRTGVTSVRHLALFRRPPTSNHACEHVGFPCSLASHVLIRSFTDTSSSLP